MWLLRYRLLDGQILGTPKSRTPESTYKLELVILGCLYSWLTIDHWSASVGYGCGHGDGRATCTDICGSGCGFISAYRGVFRLFFWLPVNTLWHQVLCISQWKINHSITVEKHKWNLWPSLCSRIAFCCFLIALAHRIELYSSWAASCSRLSVGVASKIFSHALSACLCRNPPTWILHMPLAYPLLNTYYLSTYRYKRMRWLTAY